MLVQFLAGALAILFACKTFLDFKAKKISSGSLIFWSLIWLAVLIVALAPQTTTFISRLLGIGRGVDVAVYFSIVFIFFILFEIIKKITKIEQEITKIVTEIAIKISQEK